MNSVVFELFWAVKFIKGIKAIFLFLSLCVCLASNSVWKRIDKKEL